ncbi:MAG: hypothetical protein LBK44_00645 [Spirochaetales bacterium]|nr:hypothetical protein [Spirochaetales bacterium]
MRFLWAFRCNPWRSGRSKPTHGIASGNSVRITSCSRACNSASRRAVR